MFFNRIISQNSVNKYKQFLDIFFITTRNFSKNKVFKEFVFYLILCLFVLLLKQRLLFLLLLN